MKDIELVEPTLGKILVRLENGLTLVGSREAFDSDVQITHTEDGQAEFVIVGRVKNLRGKR